MSSRKQFLVFLTAACWAASACPAVMAAAPRSSATPTPRVGINLAAPADWSTELPFVDVFHFSRDWISQAPGKGWGQGPKLELDQHGWITRLESGCWADTALCTIDGGHYPGGVYTVLYEGKGTLEVSGAATVASKGPGRMTIRVDPARGGFFLRIRTTDPKDYVRNIRVLMPGTENTYASNPWNEAFLERWRGMACVRYMDLMQTNNSTISTWAERPDPADASYARKGVPVELLVDLANRLEADPWFCMPHRADDDYIRQFATIVRDKLDPRRKAYVEYSNEVWNNMFKQNAYAAEQGMKLGFHDKPWEAGWRFTGYRSAQIFTIWEEVFGGTNRMVRVVASQAAVAYAAGQILSFRDAYKHADVLAIAPYISLNVAPNGKPPLSEVAGWTVDQVLAYLKDRALPDTIQWIRDNKAVADKFRLKLVAYEGGQHMVGVQGAENNDALTRLFHAANTAPGLQDIYRAHFDAWVAAGGDLYCYFSSVGIWSKWGSWGLLQFADDDPARSPKYQAVMGWAKALGQPVHASAAPPRPPAARPSARRPKR